jgi:hypothetical protein
LPEENATTPPPRDPAGIEDSLLKAPRNLQHFRFQKNLRARALVKRRRRQERRSNRKRRQHARGRIDIRGTDR